MSRFAKLEIKTVDEHKTRRREVRFWLSDRLGQKSLGETTDAKSEVVNIHDRLKVRSHGGRRDKGFRMEVNSRVSVVDEQ